VLVTFSETRKLREFTPSGQHVREITLQSDIDYPRHVIQLDKNRYAVIHGHSENDDGFHRVCIVNSIGTLIQSYGGNRGSSDGHLNNPMHMALFGGSLIVSDSLNNRLLLLNSSSMTTARTIIALTDGWIPVRMALSEDGSRLYSALVESLYFDINTSGHVNVMDIFWE